MCLLALFFRVAEDASVVVGANREEFYRRGGEPPRLLEGAIRGAAGVDPAAGGTWFGVNETGVFVAVTNRRKLEGPSKPRSRGLLVREMLTRPTAAAAVEHAVEQLENNRFDGANFLVADATRAVVLHAGDWLRVQPLPPGIHVLTNRDINDASDARLRYSREWLNQHSGQMAEDCLRALQTLCGQREPDDPPICFRAEDRGTVSSSLIALRDPPHDSVYRHAQGPPCETPYVDYSHLLREMRTKKTT
jgi:uncharacterized protein with NRDE domain